MSFTLTSDLALTKPPRAAEEEYLRLPMGRASLGPAPWRGGRVLCSPPWMPLPPTPRHVVVPVLGAGSRDSSSRGQRLGCGESCLEGLRAQVLPSLCPASGELWAERGGWGRCRLGTRAWRRAARVSQAWVGGEGVSLRTKQTGPAFLLFLLK